MIRPCTMSVGLVLAFCIAEARPGVAGEPFRLPRCEVVPLADHQTALQVDGIDVTRWHYGSTYPRPFFYPLNGPSGASLTRMGHPGAENHDHHRSVWFAHQNVQGVDFWSDRTGARIRQKHWYAYQDGDREAVMATLCGWYDGEQRELLEQQIVAAVQPLDEGEYTLEMQTMLQPVEWWKTFRSGINSYEPAVPLEVELGKTNFGLLAVRVAKSVSAHFGGGCLSDSEGRTGEEAIFGQKARWMDYSGPVAAGTGPDRQVVTEGITYFDHPDNPRYPTSWHVRSDGWMGASFCMHEGWTIPKGERLVLRYLLYVHRGAYDAAKAEKVHTVFAASPGFEIVKSAEPHRQYEVRRLAQ